MQNGWSLPRGEPSTWEASSVAGCKPSRLTLLARSLAPLLVAVGAVVALTSCDALFPKPPASPAPPGSLIGGGTGLSSDPGGGGSSGGGSAGGGSGGSENLVTPSPIVTAPPSGSGGMRVGIVLVTPAPATRIVETDTLIGKPIDVAIDRAAAPGESDRIWILLQDKNWLKVFDLGAKELGTYGVGNSPRGIILDAGGRGWIQHGQGQLMQVDAFGDVTKYFTGAPADSDLAVDAQGTLWITSPAEGKVLRVRTAATPQPSSTPTWTVGLSDAIGKNPAAVAIDREGGVWVVNQGSDTLVKLSEDGTKGEKTFQVGASPVDIAVDPENNIWVAANPVQKWTPAGVKLAERSGIKADRIAIAPDGSAWVLDKAAGKATHLAASDLAVVDTQTVGKSPTGLAVDSLDTVWVVNSGSETITRLKRGKQDADAAN